LDRVSHRLWSQTRPHLTTLLQNTALGLCLWRCRHLNEYVWFNDGHLTSRVHEILATELRRVFGEAVGWKERIGIGYLVDLIMVRGVS
jgi:hypothetical protein